MPKRAPTASEPSPCLGLLWRGIGLAPEPPPDRATGAGSVDLPRNVGLALSQNPREADARRLRIPLAGVSQADAAAMVATGNWEYVYDVAWPKRAGYAAASFFSDSGASKP